MAKLRITSDGLHTTTVKVDDTALPMCYRVEYEISVGNAGRAVAYCHLAEAEVETDGEIIVTRLNGKKYKLVEIEE